MNFSHLKMLNIVFYSIKSDNFNFIFNVFHKILINYYNVNVYC